MKKWILRTFSSLWLILTIQAIAQTIQNGQALVTIFMFIQCIIAWQFCNATWQDNCNELGK